jgi:predicted DNA-binding WGR domain protein
MPEAALRTFLEFLAEGVGKGGFETDDTIAAVLPLMKQTLRAHEQGRVAPLDGLREISVGENGDLAFADDQTKAPLRNAAQVEQIQAPFSHAVEVIGRSRHTSDIDQSSFNVADLNIAALDDKILRPVFLPNYTSWEHAIAHHDQLTDIFSLGMLLASVACGLDFTDRGELELFTGNRANLFAVNSRLNPVVASVIVQMTELNRHKRAPDLAQMISRLERYREQTVELDFNRIKGFEESPITGKRRLIQSHLRDRLFEISRRNRLIYFKPTLHTLNLTVASVPILLDYRNIKLEQLFVWHPALAATVTEGAPMSLGKYLRFEDALYIPAVLDKIISEARRDRAEYGFAQLRLVLCFLRWNNLKEGPNERVHSPLLLLPVELTKKKGVRDNYVLDPTNSEAEVNPALRHHLKELYNLNLPESIDLKETTLDQFYESLKAQIHASEPGVTLNKIDRPQIQLIHEKARQRLDQYRRRQKLQARKAESSVKPEYSYDREHFQPLGLQLFLKKVRPTPLPLRGATGGPPAPRLPHIVEADGPPGDGKTMETEREMYALRGDGNDNPYSWDFDLCSVTLGNFNYRKMTLVRDYSKLIETDMASGAFDTIFSLTPKPQAEAPAPLRLEDQHVVISCDATQAGAIARARTGASYIIQGPPGTGKSQTITNLIADYVGRGKRVLFVCEKRAAIDVVFHRLRQQGLDELCCLIHDSQTDKKAFIQNLKQTYEKFLGQSELDPDVAQLRAATVRAMEQELANLKRFSEVMSQMHAHSGIPIRSLLHRLIELRGRARELPAETDDLLPDYPLWLQHGELVNRLRSALAELGDNLCFAQHPLRWLGKGVLQADRPLETLSRRLDEAEDLLDSIEGALELSGLPAELWDTFEEIQAVLEFASHAKPLAERGLLGVLNDAADEKNFDALAKEIDSKTDAFQRAQEKTIAWRDPLSADDAENALSQAKSFESSMLRFLQPAFWRLRKTLDARYDFSKHAVAPAWTKILGDLRAFQTARADLESLRAKAAAEWRADDVDSFRKLVNELRNDPRASHPSVKSLLALLSKSDQAPDLVKTLADIHGRFASLDATLHDTLAEHDQFEFPELTQALTAIRHETDSLAELLPILADLCELPQGLAHALRHAPVPLDDFEAAIGHKTVNRVYREDRAVNRFDSRTLARRLDNLDKHHREWLSLNARTIRATVRQKFLEHVNVSSLPAAQLDASQKAFKKSYSAGRRDLEHEFGKTMRYKSIRDLAAGDTGQVVQDLKPIWLMSPLSVSDTLPLDPNLFDVVIFDEASQIPLEEAIPAAYRSQQVIVVGDEMQLPPTTFFAGARGDEESLVVEEAGERVEIDLNSDSFLTQSAQNLPSTLLAWHYRSRYEALISFSNAAFYSGNLFTIPDRARPSAERPEIVITAPGQGSAHVDDLLARSISFHFMENGLYEDRRNPNEGAYIAQLVRGVLQRETKLSIGIVAFSEAQQTELESALNALAETDCAFAAQLETEFTREENDVFCGLFVKNLENVQGDERDVIIMSVCYGHDANGRMLMNFGPINQSGGEKRLNVIFSRAKHHMAVVSSIRHNDITNDYNDGASSLKNFLHYAEAISKGDESQARRILENLNPLNRKTLAAPTAKDTVVDKLAEALRGRGYIADTYVGQSKFRCDLAVRQRSQPLYELAVLVDTEFHYANQNLLDRYLLQPGVLRAFGWRSTFVLTKDWYHQPEEVIARLEKLLRNEEVTTVEELEEPGPAAPAEQPLVAKLQPAPQKTHAKATSPEIRRFELIGGGSKKFWEISQAGSSISVRFGRIGTSGQEQTKAFSDDSAAAREINRLIAEKVKKGYTGTN